MGQARSKGIAGMARSYEDWDAAHGVLQAAVDGVAREDVFHVIHHAGLGLAEGAYALPAQRTKLVMAHRQHDGVIGPLLR